METLVDTRRLILKDIQLSIFTQRSCSRSVAKYEDEIGLNQLNTLDHFRLAIDPYPCLRVHQTSRAFLLQTVSGAGNIRLWINFDKNSGYSAAGLSKFLCGLWLPLPLPGLSPSSSVLVSNPLFPIPQEARHNLKAV